MWMFDENIYIATSKHSKECPLQIQNITDRVERDLIANSTGRATVMNKMKVNPAIHNGDFAFFFADIFVISVQYGGRTKLCDLMSSIQSMTYEDQLA